jgi:predicted glycosyltransferase
VSRRRVFFYVQHLLGIGHLKRAATLARAFTAAGLDVAVVSGGHQVPGLDVASARFIQLPPTRATDLYFKDLVDENDAAIDDSWRSRRREALGEAWRAYRPHVILFELFPFGRRQLRFEIVPLLDAALADPQRPCIASSVRDILVAQHKPERNLEMLDLVERYFDRVLVHGDPSLVPFERTFPHAARISGKIAYTGYVVDRSGQRGGPGSPGQGEVVVSAGGGAVGLALLRTAIAARPMTRLKSARWRVLVGISLAEVDFEALRAAAPEGVVVERARPDFTSLLMNCALSISQGGYNTVMELIGAGARAVVVPYAGGIETEQTLRAKALEARRAIHVLDEAALSPETLAAAVETATDGPRGDAGDLNTGGAERSAALVKDWAEAVPW